MNAPAVLTERVSLVDGRTLTYAPVGDPDGVPTIYFHGTPSSRLGVVAMSQGFTAAGVRAVGFDRPGMGGSTFRTSGGFTPLVADVEALADHLGLERFVVLGYSGGGPHALSVAAALRSRVLGAVIVSGSGPPDRPGAFDGMNPVERGLDVLTERVPIAARAVFAVLARVMALAPHLTGRLLVDSIGHEGDVQASLDDFGLDAVSPFIEAFAQGSVGPVADYRRLLRPWDFDPTSITVPVQLWHGDADDTVPLHNSTALASAIGGATLHVVEGEGHAMIYAHIAEIAAAVAALG